MARLCANECVLCGGGGVGGFGGTNGGFASPYGGFGFSSTSAFSPSSALVNNITPNDIPITAVETGDRGGGGGGSGVGGNGYDSSSLSRNGAASTRLRFYETRFLFNTVFRSKVIGDLIREAQITLRLRPPQRECHWRRLYSVVIRIANDNEQCREHRWWRRRP